MDRESAPAEPLGPPIILPPHPPEPAIARFPVLATVAPVAGALVLWMLTGSAISLAFAALGPLVAVASVFDARRQARRARRRGAAERAEQLESVRAEIAERHARERADAWRRSPSTRRLAEGGGSFEWRDGSPGTVVLGRGTTTSRLRLDGAAAGADDRELLEFAGRIDDAPVIAPTGGGIGIVGPLPLARASARALVVQLAHRCRPGRVEFSFPEGAAWSWALTLPHHRGGGDCVVRVVDAGSGGHGSHGARPAPRGQSPSHPDVAGATIAVSESLSRLPVGLETILAVKGPRLALIDGRSLPSADSAIVPELLAASEAAAFAAQMRAAATREGIGAAAALPARFELDSLEQPVPEFDSRASLRVGVGVVHGGDLQIDLVADGPHAIVAGTTGSGKSEFLLAWLAALMLVHPPSRVAFLLVDFKGGAAFEPLRGLPHVTGIVTDLDEAEAERAVLSLCAELRHREEVLRTERVRDIAELDPEVELARLVIVVDEFQAMIERFSDLGAVIADIAARGRSLGVHLVLASQRPNGVVREQVTANCAIRVSLRVMHRADSIAVVGTEAAASIRPDAPGRGIIDVGDDVPVAFQSAQVEARTLARLRRAHAGAAPSRRPWVDPLPSRLSPGELERAAGPDRPDPDSIRLGLVDQPERQRHGVLRWSPRRDGHLLVIGAPGSGRTNVLAAVADAAARQAPALPVVRLHGGPSRQWDELQSLLQRVAQPEAPMLVLVDDLDAQFRGWPDAHRHSALAGLEAVLREGRRAGVTVVATTGQAHRLGQGIRESFGSLLLLRHPTRSDLVHAGGSGELWRREDPPGSGQWRGNRVQVVAAPPLPDVGHQPPPRVHLAAGICAVVTGTPRADAAALRAVGLDPIVLEPVGDTVVRAALARRAAGASDVPEPTVIVADADAWAANWSIAALMREEATVLVRGGAREYRTFASGPALPPLLDDPAAECWLVEPGTAPRRAAWPPAQTTETVAVHADRELNPHPMFPEINDSDMIA